MSPPIGKAPAFEWQILNGDPQNSARRMRIIDGWLYQVGSPYTTTIADREETRISWAYTVFVPDMLLQHDLPGEIIKLWDAIHDERDARRAARDSSIVQRITFRVIDVIEQIKERIR